MTQTIHSLNNRKKKENLYCQKKKTTKRCWYKWKKERKTQQKIFSEVLSSL
jgi:hypothetical protein